ncbi:MAG: hypothetical protein M2R45_00634 [Verrucomicrobia subdivision 3 bacterium]|nr:hypothetical protein [Limisphaerales bacterium]MCS1414483.1 hypothetical protein [Limisphaerales bacterium]
MRELRQVLRGPLVFPPPNGWCGSGLPLSCEPILTSPSVDVTTVHAAHWIKDLNS